MYEMVYVFKNLYCIILYINSPIHIYIYSYCRKYVLEIVSKYVLVCVTGFYNSI